MPGGMRKFCLKEIFAKLQLWNLQGAGLSPRSLLCPVAELEYTHEPPSAPKSGQKLAIDALACFPFLAAVCGSGAPWVGESLESWRASGLHGQQDEAHMASSSSTLVGEFDGA